MEVLARLVLTHLVAQQEIDPRGGKGAQDRHNHGMLEQEGKEESGCTIAVSNHHHGEPSFGEERLDTGAPTEVEHERDEPPLHKEAWPDMDMD